MSFIFMIWNLFLAWVPLFFIKWVWEQEKRASIPIVLLGVYFIVWLLFFPNAPYLITDIKHLRGVEEHTIWFDSLMLFSFAFSGFLTGLYSIRIVFLGRYGRWNSWDIITQPGALFRGILDSLQNPLAIKHTLAFSFVLMMLYFAFHFFDESKEHERSHKYS